MGLQLVVAGFLFPALVVGGGEFISAGVGGVQDGGEQGDQLVTAVTGAVGDVVFDDADQMRDLFTRLVERVRDVVQVGQAGGGAVRVPTMPSVLVKRHARIRGGVRRADRVGGCVDARGLLAR
jgi:hypothetical protein